MADGLLHPAAVAGMLTLPSLAQPAASTGAGAVLLMAGESVAAAGPVGIVAGLLVLAGVILLNGQTFASAAFHALNTDQREQFASALGNRTRDLATVLAFANGANTSASVGAARASAVASARLSGAARTANSLSDAQRLATAAGAARADAERLASRASVERTLRHAALAAMEEMDDFAGGIHIGDLGRDTEGYGVLQKLTPDGYRPFPYGGDLGVSVPNGDGMRPLPRNEWRALLRSLTGADLDTTVFSYHLTETDGIPVDEANRFVAACQAAGGLLNLQLQRYQALAA